MGSVKKWRMKKISKHKHRKRLKATRWQRKRK
ncbi:MAG: AURKAIP1/COX24 domain-containing protein [Chloroflexi bacterium]|nr:AURKAIP1/COX24 domain-containing protein [Chloroflexota bacterium]MBU1749923.1 AURKAIP1/COX24 domain-containing protein [Chloroflexota bacterium]